jgi:hypothetical protein
MATITTQLSEIVVMPQFLKPQFLNFPPLACSFDQRVHLRWPK